MLITDRGAKVAKVFFLPQCYLKRQARGKVDQEILEMRFMVGR